MEETRQHSSEESISCLRVSFNQIISIKMNVRYLLLEFFVALWPTNFKTLREIPVYKENFMWILCKVWEALSHTSSELLNDE